ncbi:MAG: mitochondrial fission ELM1 family protein [Nitrospiria bacterium]
MDPRLRGGDKERTCWTITDTFPGMKSQVEGLADAIGLPTIHKTCKRKWPWGWLGLSLGNPLSYLTNDSDPLTPPWPDVVISCGRRSAPLALGIKKKSQGKTLCIHIQNPIVNRASFDLILAPEHDKLEGSNVMLTKGALHKLTQAKLAQGIETYGYLFKDLPRPFSTVLIGGSTNRYTFTLDAMKDLIDKILHIREITKGSVLVTPSFRTSYRDMLTHALTEEPHIFLADIETLNPYFAMVGLADTLFVTNDSVSMVCEACYSGKPVYILPLIGHNNTKPKEFVEGLMAEKIVRPFERSIDSWTYTPFNDTEKMGRYIREKFSL